MTAPTSPRPEGPSPRVALVTGASRGIGRAVALAMLADGWQVALLARDATQLAQAVADSGAADRALALAVDVSDAPAVARAFDDTVARFGRLDFLFNNAGVFAPPAPLAEFPLSDWQRSVDVNLTGMFVCLQQAFRVMQAQSPRGGRILNNGSLSAQAPRPHAIAYTATKHAVTGLTNGAALEGRAHGISVGQIDLGNVATDMTERMASGVLQADGTTRPEDRMSMAGVVSLVRTIADLPADAHLLSTTLLATGMPFVGRG